ncbi:23S rRNA (uridine(2552)-2'-O)-methyltransferase RlmE [Spiribacter salinus]|jgi:23S rRNA (uridine2552-2'-O)-methyltransferase|uniref:Ribosomal RNA large subunit methyltransferase E n=1 Tax=Spiribacter salinus TaxID=1335746 RepID=A0A540VRQ7_9GAMM|nr:23S rRNA (uridine(2552)-2'-O)-methyltransferase RlmE [Spiribacter salinus]MBY5267934.1 23S rRNA methyltransferase [Spiribacter salinus]MDR9413721.1 23S rRNA (uridine(2552)-2'-O)-methyltransferase RlmE [Spiribacter sp.]TQE99457.1 MAG: 23S rRNA (uridine(2552)-2'-O)-methyltransferase RlmE [Spiribacter salinus]
MPRSRGSQRWLKEHFNDPYVREAQRRGLRSRAVFKLEEIDERDQLLSRGQSVVDLGAAPGGWSAYAASKVGPSGRVVAIDLLEMPPVPNVTFVQADFSRDEGLAQLDAALAGSGVDLVMSDMAPNLSGQKAVDQPRSMFLAELALDFCQERLNPGGGLLVKVFQGQGFDELLKAMRERFAKVQSRKPEASRNRSREVYLLARGFRA